MERKIRKLKRFAEGTLDPSTAKAYRKKVRQAQQELKAFVDENYDVLHRDYSREKVYGGVDKSAESGIIKETSKKPVTKITDNAINSVVNVKITGYTDEQCEFIQQQHKELLEYSRANNDNKEVAFVFDGEFKKRKEFLVKMISLILTMCCMEKTCLLCTITRGIVVIL